MKEAVLGAKESPSAGPMDQIVVPPTGLSSASVQPKAAPPQSCTSMPRCRLYQACIAFGSLALKKMPPIPVTRFMCTSRGKMRRFAWAYSPSLSTAGSTTHDRMSALLPDPRLRGRPGRVRDGGSWTGTAAWRPPQARRVLETTCPGRFEDSGKSASDQITLVQIDNTDRSPTERRQDSSP